MSLVNRQLYIGGMTCINCQNKIQKKLRNIAGIRQATVSYSRGDAQIRYDTDLVSLEDIISVIEDLGYEARSEKRRDNGTSRTLSFLVIIISLYVILQRLGILNLLVPSQLADTGMGYGMLFLIGIITSVHCIAMCGGINLTQCIPGNEPGAEKGKFSVLRPSLLYNFGRVISYTLIGFILGLVGMLVSGGSGVGLPTLIQGILKIIAGVFMVIMGINMLGIFPWLRKFTVRMPRFLAVRVGKRRRPSSRPLFVGLLNGLMPCGPLQSMQIVALASGNPLVGGASMLMFSLGTVPLMLGLGSLVSALGRRFAQAVTSVGSVLVVVLGLAMLSQGGSLSGLLSPQNLLVLILALSIFGVAGNISLHRAQHRAVSFLLAAVIVLVGVTGWNRFVSANQRSENSDVIGDGAEIADGVQVVNSTLTPGTYPDITVQAGTPVRWVIDAPQGSINGCNYMMILPEYGIQHTFETGENVIEFTPEEAGTYGYTCWMGMIRANIYVTDENGEILPAETDSAENVYSGGFSCCEP